MKTITVWNNARQQRNLDRLYKWLKLAPDFSGRVYRDGDVAGYKTANYYFDVTFHIYKRGK